jgi:hypothetical protein
MPLAFFNLGTQEIVILTVGALCCLGVVGGAVALLVMLSSKKQGPGNE